MYYDNYYQDEGEREEERVEDKRRVEYEDDDEDDEETRRERIIAEAREVYSGAYMDEGSSQRTLSQWRGVSRFQSKM